MTAPDRKGLNKVSNEPHKRVDYPSQGLERWACRAPEPSRNGGGIEEDSGRVGDVVELAWKRKEPQQTFPFPSDSISSLRIDRECRWRDLRTYFAEISHGCMHGPQLSPSWANLEWKLLLQHYNWPKFQSQISGKCGWVQAWYHKSLQSESERLNRIEEPRWRLIPLRGPYFDCTPIDPFACIRSAV